MTVATYCHSLASNFQLIPYSTEKAYKACFKPQAASGIRRRTEEDE
jgi:hypothetical protein